jgi:hypothetical protein
MTRNSETNFSESTERNHKCRICGSVLFSEEQSEEFACRIDIRDMVGSDGIFGMVVGLLKAQCFKCKAKNMFWVELKTII